MKKPQQPNTPSLLNVLRRKLDAFTADDVVVILKEVELAALKILARGSEYHPFSNSRQACSVGQLREILGELSLAPPAPAKRKR